MDIIRLILLCILVVCAVSVTLTKNLLSSVIIYMAYSSVMALIWILLQSPDLGVTEAAVGAGVTSILFFLTLRRMNMIGGDKNGKNKK